MCFGGDGGAGDIARAQRQDEIDRQNRIKAGMSRIDQIFKGFDDAYYKKQGDAYSAYATPQLDRSYRDAKDNMIYALDRSGILSSSAAIKKNADLTNEFDQNRLDIANKAQTVANDARANVENVRGNLVNQLNATGDDTAAANAAIRQATALNQPQLNFSPLSQLFYNFTQGLQAIGSNARNDYSGLLRGGSGLFSNSGGSARVVG
ncbi:MAG: hypothetical protein K2Q27_01965 [Novosphingobium sp.]|nr:hypothetical protein [Novosphingobium sp.]